MHVAGAELCSESWADEVEGCHWPDSWPCCWAFQCSRKLYSLFRFRAFTDKLMWIARRLVSSKSKTSMEDTPRPTPTVLALLTPIKACSPTPKNSEVHRRVLALPQAARRELTKAFREHFQVPRNARSIGDRISQRQHSNFIALFLEEAQGQLSPEPVAEPGS